MTPAAPSSGSGRAVGLALLLAVVVAAALVAALGAGVWFALRGNGSRGTDVVPVDAALALEPTSGGTRVRLTLTVVGTTTAPVRVATALLDDGYAIDDPPYSGTPAAGPAATGQEVRWVDPQSGGRPLPTARVGFAPLSRNGSGYELTAEVPMVGGRRVVLVQGLGPYVEVRRLTVTAPAGAVTSCLVTYSASPRRASRVTPCQPSTSMRPQVPPGVEATVPQGEQRVRFELAAP